MWLFRLCSLPLFNAERLIYGGRTDAFFPFLRNHYFCSPSERGLGCPCPLYRISIRYHASNLRYPSISKEKGFQLEWGIHHSYLLKVLKIASLQTIALFLASIMPVMDRVIVSFLLSEGNVTAIENATRLCQIPWSLATVGYMNVFYSWWSR